MTKIFNFQHKDLIDLAALIATTAVLKPCDYKEGQTDCINHTSILVNDLGKFIEERSTYFDFDRHEFEKMVGSMVRQEHSLNGSQSKMDKKRMGHWEKQLTQDGEV